MKCKYMFMFPLKNLARKGFISFLLVYSMSQTSFLKPSSSATQVNDSSAKMTV